MRSDHASRYSLIARKAGFKYLLLAMFAAATILVVAGRAGAQTPAQTGSQDAAAPKLAGQWQLNKDQSDDPRQKMQAARSDSGSGGGEGGGYGGGRGRGGRNGGGRGQGGGMMDEWAILRIEQTGSNVKVTGKSGRVLAQYPSSDTSSDTGGDKSAGGEREGWRTTTAQWQNDQLTVVTQGQRGKSTRAYSLSSDGKQLYVATKMENDRFKEPVTYRLVYDPVASKAGGDQ